MKYYVYHIPSKKKVGLSRNVESRLTEQGFTEDQYEIIDEFDDLDEALNAEQEYNTAFKYKKTPRWHPDMDKEKVTKNENGMKVIKRNGDDKLSVTITYDFPVMSDLDNGLKIILPEGEFVFEGDDLTELKGLVKAGRYGGPGAGFVYVEKMINLRHDLNERRMDIIGQNGNDGLHYEKKWQKDILIDLHNQATVTIDKPAKQFNECADLDVPMTGATLQEVMDLQASFQKRFPETADIGNQTIADTATAAQRNLHAFLDEVMEFMDALGGMHDGYKNGGWKYWKKDHAKAKEMKISDLSDRDLKELKMEYCDMFHFFLNWGIMIGMEGSELIDYYMSKNKENIDRQKRGY